MIELARATLKRIDAQIEQNKANMSRLDGYRWALVDLINADEAARKAKLLTDDAAAYVALTEQPTLPETANEAAA